MNQRQHKSTASYITTLAGLMKLQAWTFDLLQEQCESGSWASISVTFGCKHARIRLAANWQDQTADEMRQTLVHELVHCHTDGMHQTSCDVEPVIGSAAFVIHSAAFLNAMEHCVDDIADIIAPNLPLPPKSAMK